VAERGSSRFSLWARIGAVVGVVASIVAIATGVKALVDDGGGGGGGTPDEPEAEVRARHVRECVQEHELTQAAQTRPPQPGETDIARPEPLPEFAVFEQRAFATCEWPPPPGAFADGYRAITVTMVDGPGEFEATGSTYADRVESRCEVLELDYLFGSMGEFEHLPPIRGRPGETLRNNGEPWSAAEFGEGEARTLPFYPGRDELVVLHNNKNVLEDVRCAS
jgi:hypothetical protein